MKKTILLTAAAVLFSFSVQAAPVADQSVSGSRQPAVQKETKPITPYAAVKAVYSWEKVKINDEESFGSSSFKSPGVNIAVGADLQGIRAEDGIRAEIEYAYRALKSKTSVEEDIVGKEKFGMQTYMLNAYYDFSTKTFVKPYVGFGLGLADIKIKYQDAEDLASISKTKFAWNLNAGLGFEVTENVTFDIGYRYLRVEDVKKDFDIGSMKIKTRANEFSVGVRFDF